MRPGDPAPDFELPDQDGVPRRLSTMLLDGPVALFFYPVAGSGGCTREMCAVRDAGEDFAAAGAQRVGISRDPVEVQARFAADHGLDFPLLADVDGSVCAAYGTARSGGLAPVRRHTVVVGTDGHVREVLRSEFRFTRHARGALGAVTAG